MVCLIQTLNFAEVFSVSVTYTCIGALVSRQRIYYYWQFICLSTVFFQLSKPSYQCWTLSTFSCLKFADRL